MSGLNCQKTEVSGAGRAEIRNFDEGNGLIPI